MLGWVACGRLTSYFEADMSVWVRYVYMYTQSDSSNYHIYTRFSDHHTLIKIGGVCIYTADSMCVYTMHMLHSTIHT